MHVQPAMLRAIQAKASLQQLTNVALRLSGRLVVIEYRKEVPNIPIAVTHRMSVADLRTEIAAAGFALDRLDEGLPRQHVIVFRNPSLH
jgi:hypothetical protein